MFALDNDTASLLFRGRNSGLNRRALAVPPKQLWLPAVVVEEQFRGRLGVLAKLNPVRSKDSALIPVAYRDLVLTEEFLRQFQILPYTQADEDLYQSWSAAVKRVGTRDCRIAASAINRGLIIVTANLRHFQQIPGVQITDWSV
jgi:tRNA(fMet)-specific endonuclease VapC